MVRQNPLNWNVPIVDPKGRPTKEFMQKWALQTQINGSIPQLATQAQVSAVLDAIGATPNDILQRGLTEWQAVTLTQALDTIGNADGDILIRKAGVWTALASPADASQYLDGTGAYSKPAGALAVLASGSASAAADCKISISAYTGYRELWLCFHNLLSSNNGDGINMRTSSNGGVSFDNGASDYWWAHHRVFAGTGAGAGGADTGNVQDLIQFNAGNGLTNTAANVGAHGCVKFFDWGNSAKKQFMQYDMTHHADNNIVVRVAGSALRNTANVITDLRLFLSTGVITLNWALYGLT